MTNVAIIEMPTAGSRGLTTLEAERRLVKHGPNALPEAAARPLWRRFADQSRSPLIYILLFAVAFDLVVWLLEGASGVPFEAAVIGAVVPALRGILGVVPLDPAVWLAVLGAVLVTWIAAEGVSRSVQRQ